MVGFPMQMLGDLVAIRPEKAAQRGKIFLPDWNRSLRGRILAVGPDCKEVKVGETASFRATSGMESVFDGAPLRVMREDDLDFKL